MTEPPALFDIPDGAHIEPPQPETPGERLRRRQAEQITAGYHPLCAQTPSLRLLDPAARSATSRERAREIGLTQTCGTCRFRVMVNGGARDWPKCGHDAPNYPNGAIAYANAPRYTSGATTDTKAWWPGCVDWQAKEVTDV